MKDLEWRQREYATLGLDVRWLEHKRAKNAYDYALGFTSSTRYGLSEKTVESIEHYDIESYSVADKWLRDRLNANGTVQIVYGPEEVCVIEAGQFLLRWQDIFCPGRDDAVILHNLNKTIVFYCHEEELEFGERNA